MCLNQCLANSDPPKSHPSTPPCSTQEPELALRHTNSISKQLVAGTHSYRSISAAVQIMVGRIMVIYRSQCRRTAIDQESSGGPREPERGTGDTQALPKNPTMMKCFVTHWWFHCHSGRSVQTNVLVPSYTYIFMSICNYFLLPYTGLMYTVAEVSQGDVSFLCFLLPPSSFVRVVFCNAETQCNWNTSVAYKSLLAELG